MEMWTAKTWGKKPQVEYPKLWAEWLMKIMGEDDMSYLASKDQPNYWLGWIDSAIETLYTLVPDEPHLANQGRAVPMHAIFRVQNV